MYHRKYEVLHVSGMVNESELVATWEAIFQEYCSLLELTQYLNTIKLIKQMALLSSRLSAVNAMIGILSMGYCKEAVEKLHELGYKYPFNQNDVRGYHANIDMVITKSKTIVVKLQIAEAELMRIEEENGGKKTNEIDFINGVTAISKYMGFRIDITTCTVLEYISYNKAYQSYIRIMEAKNGR